MRHVARWAILSVLCASGSQQAYAQDAASGPTMTFSGQHQQAPAPAALSHELAPWRGPPWGQGGPWADQAPYAPRPKPAGWIDPEPSRWPWTGERDPYDYANGNAALTAQERCPEAPVDVTAGSPDERSLACSAANVALELLRRCKISPRRPLHVQIVDEVRHPFSGPIFGHFDTKQERVWSRSTRTFRLWSKTLPMASSRSAISTRA